MNNCTILLHTLCLNVIIKYSQYVKPVRYNLKVLHRNHVYINQQIKFVYEVYKHVYCLSTILHTQIFNGSLVMVIKGKDEYKFRAPPFIILHYTKIVTPHVLEYSSKL
jgi:hypothetical protein